MRQKVLNAKPEKETGAHNITNAARHQMRWHGHMSLMGSCDQDTFQWCGKQDIYNYDPEGGKNGHSTSHHPTASNLLDIKKTYLYSLPPREKQFFRADHSTTLQLARLSQALISATNKREGVIFLDFELPFDRVWYDGLLYKLAKAEIPRGIVLTTSNKYGRPSEHLPITNILCTDSLLP